MFDTATLAAYKQQLEGLTVTQQKMALMTTNLTAAQREQVLSYIASTTATKTLTAEEFLACTADEKRILVKAGLIAEEQVEKGAVIDLTQEKLKEILADETLNATEKNTILTKFGVTGANLTEASSWEVLGKSIGKATVQMLKWLFLTPAGWATIAIAGVVGLIGAYAKWGPTLENTREKLEDLKSECDTIASDLESVNSELETTKKRMDELEGKGTLTFTEKEEYDNLVKTNNELQRTIDLLKLEQAEKNKEKNKTFVDAMEKDVYSTDYYKDNLDDGKIKKGQAGTSQHRTVTTEQAYINQQFKEYQDNLDRIAELDEQYKDDLSNKQYQKDRKRIEDQNEKISKYLRDKNTDFTTDAEGIDYIEEPKNEDEEKVNQWLDFINDFQDRMAIAMDGDNAKTNAFNRVVDNWQFDETVQGLQDLGKQGQVTAEMLDDPKYDAFIQKLVDLGVIDSADALDEVALAFNNVGTEAENSSGNVDKMTVSLSEMEKASDKISKLGSAFKELSDDGYITTKTLGELQTATGLSGDEWAEYENRLLNAKKGSADFNQVLSELTYKILENEFATIDLTNATDEEITAIENKIAATLRENGVENANAVAHEYVRMARVNAAIAAYDGTQASYDSAAALISESLSAEQAMVAMNQLELAKINVNNAKITSSDDIDNIIAIANAALASEQTLKDLAKAKAELAEGFVGPVSKSTMDMMNGTYEFDFDKLDPSDFKVGVPRYTGGSSKSGSDKNKPDYEDPTDAIINRINLRAKELEQQEESIQNAIEIAELEKDYEKQISLTNDLIAARKNRVNELNAANAALHNEAEWLRNSNPYDEESWFDSQGNATEAYYNLLNGASTKDEQDAIKDLFEKLNKYKEAYKDNADEITDINKQLLEDAENLNDLYTNLYDENIRNIEHARDMWLEQNPFGDTTEYYRQLQDEYHKEAERLRALDPEKYAEEIQELEMAWHDAQNAIADWSLTDSENWIDERDFYNDWNNYGDTKAQAWKRVLDRFKTEFPEELDKIQEIEHNYYDALKEEVTEFLDLESSRLDSRKTLLQSYYDVTNSIAEAQHEINKELEASKTMYEWLDEDTRNLLFNQEDYNVLSEELYDIQYKADKLQRQYQYDLEHATLETIEEITSNYEMQYETLMKSYEISKADLEIAKKKQKLNNVLNERNVRMFIDGQWQWVANTQDVIDAQNELADAEYEAQRARLEKEQTDSINDLTTQQDKLSTTINKFEKGIINLDGAVQDVIDIFGRIPSAIQNSISAIQGKSSISSYSSSSGGGSYSSSSSGLANIYKSQDYAQGVYNALDKGDVETALKSNELRNEKIDYLGLSEKKWTEADIRKMANEGYATGTRYTRAGNALIGEVEPEVYIDNVGHLIPINQPTLANLGSGGIVFNQDQMDFARKIWDWSNVGVSPSNLPMLITRNENNAPAQNIYGDIILQNVNNPEDLWKQLGGYLKHTRYKSN